MIKRARVLWKNDRRHEPTELDTVELWQEFDEENNSVIGQCIKFYSLWETIDINISDAVNVAKSILDNTKNGDEK